MQDCPKVKHFHVACTDVTEEKDFNFIFEVSDPNSALSEAIQDLPDDWEGSIEVNEHSTHFESSMPLLDFWRTPKMLSFNLCQIVQRARSYLHLLS